ncbi:MAG: beta-ketoacyl-ACP synthase II [Eubacteriales bacterium]|nr:beta-ketoacyl-ACP synthase II [Eubacteriales bacterium]
MRRVVITGLGAVSPIGNDIEELWDSVKNGKNGIAPITRFDTSGFKIKLAGELKGFDPEKYVEKREARKMAAFTLYARAAADQAVTDSGLDFSAEDTDRCGVIISSGIGGLENIESEEKRGMEKGYERVSPHFIPMAISNMAAGQVAIAHGLHGMCSCVVTACASGTNAIGDSFRYIRDGYADIMLAGGTEASITPLGIGGFASMKALCDSTDPDRASVPFDAERGGFVMGEGSGILVLEEYEHAVRRGARIYCEVIGYGANCDAHHVTAPLPDGSGAAKCMAMALKDGNISPEDIDYINAHGTSTKLNDSGETKAVKLTFGDHAKKLMMSSTKSMTGHLLGASGAVEGVITALSIYHGFVPATINYRVPDEECDLDIVPNVGREYDIRYAMSNSLGFGGHNASIIFKKV